MNLEELRDRLSELKSYIKSAEYVRQQEEVRHQIALRRTLLVEAPLDSVDNVLALIRARGELSGMQYALMKVGLDIQDLEQDIRQAVEDEENDEAVGKE